MPTIYQPYMDWAAKQPAGEQSFDLFLQSSPPTAKAYDTWTKEYTKAGGRMTQVATPFGQIPGISEARGAVGMGMAAPRQRFRLGADGTLTPQ
jgi:hypothetical protein